jgi:uncharacterized protein YicC (UPF0701 family)
MRLRNKRVKLNLEKEMRWRQRALFTLQSEVAAKNKKSDCAEEVLRLSAAVINAQSSGDTIFQIGVPR